MNSGSSWSQRNGVQYRRLCARAGCGAPAVATLRFQSTEREAWLSELDDNAARTQGDLCSRHAASLVLPRGWELHDERASAVAAANPTVAPSEDSQAVTADAGGADAGKAEANKASANKASANKATAKNGKARRRARAKRPGAGADVSASASANQLPGLEPAAAAATDRGEADAPESEAGEPYGPVEIAAPALSAPFGVAPAGANDDDVEDALGAILDARTPLLQRAFRNAKPL